MRRPLQERGFDELDLAILEALQVDGRISVADLARRIHLSQPAVHHRIKRLERQGVIRQYVALLDREIAGYDLLCFIQVGVQAQPAGDSAALQAAIHAMPEVLECFRLTGNDDLLLKVVAHNHRQLDRFISERLRPLAGVERIDTNVVLNEMKATTALALR